MNEVGTAFLKGAGAAAGAAAINDPDKLRKRAEEIDDFVVDHIIPEEDRERGGHLNNLTGWTITAGGVAAATGNMPVAFGCITAATAIETRSLAEKPGCTIL